MKGINPDTRTPFEIAQDEEAEIQEKLEQKRLDEIADAEEDPREVEYLKSKEE
jgi:hypothetical protein